MSLIVDDHRAYVSDPVRVDAFQQALAACVRPGDVVVDLGCGTGLLGLLACRAGARHVYALETNGMIEVARAIARANGLADRFTFINEHSADVELPEPADVLVGDLIGNMGFEMGLFGLYRDAVRFMKPEGRMIPRSISLYVAPVSAADIFEDVRFWQDPRYGIDLGPVTRWAVNTGYPRRVERSALLGDDAVAGEFDPRSEHPMLRLHGSVRIARDASMHGLAGWFDAELAPAVRLTNSPLAENRLSRRNIFFPLERAAEVTAGTSVEIDVRIRPYDSVVSWSAVIPCRDGVRQERHSTINGMLLSREDMRAHAPGRRPRLTARGAARRSILELCDGLRTTTEIEREVYERHRDLFRNSGEAQAFVAEVVTRYTEQDR